MLSGNMISANEFCLHHHIQLSFLQSLHEYELIEMIMEENDGLLKPDQLDLIEKMIRLHYDLHINLEGIDAIHHLLQQMNNMQAEMISLKNKLRLYEDAP